MISNVGWLYCPSACIDCLLGIMSTGQAAVQAPSGPNGTRYHASEYNVHTSGFDVGPRFADRKSFAAAPLSTW